MHVNFSGGKEKTRPAARFAVARTISSTLSLSIFTQQPVKTALLLTSSDAAAADSVSYVACTLGESEPGFVLGTPPVSSLAEVGARWWGRVPEADAGAKAGAKAPAKNATAAALAPLRDWGVVGCSTVWLAGGRSVRVHGDVSSDCVAEWTAVPGGKGALLTATRKGGGGAGAILWQLSLASDPRSPARLTCAGVCPVTAAASPCTPTQVASASNLRLPSPKGAAGGGASFAQALAGAESSCTPGWPAPETAPWPAPPEAELSYGLAAQFFSNVYGPECADPAPWSWYGVPPDMEAAPWGPASRPRCVGGVDFRGPTTAPWPSAGEPALDPDLYSSCFGATLAGWVKMPAPPAPLAWNAPGPVNASYADRFRVCARFTSQVEMVLAGSPVALASPDPRTDLTFDCKDLYLDGGAGRLAPLSVRFASPPTDRATVLQLWVIPAVGVYGAGDGMVDVAYACDACTPFSPVADLCCPPLGSCAFRSVCEGGGGGGGGGGTPTPEPTLTAPPPETTAAPPPETTAAPPTPPPETTPPGGYGGYGGGYGTTPPPPETTAPPPPETTAPPPPETTAPLPPETTAPPPPETTAPSPPETTAPPPPETTAPPPPETTPPGPTCPPDALDVAARRDWAAFQSAAAAATGPDEFALLLELGAGRP